MRKTLLPVLLWAALAGCGNDRSDGPPDVRYGLAECASCGMIVSNERYAAAAVLPRGEPNRELIFDDISCLLDLERSRGLPADSKRYVHDVNSLAWLAAGDARFVTNPAVHTPMGSGLQAFGPSSATIPTESLTYDQLLAARPPGDPAESTGK